MIRNLPNSASLASPVVIAGEGRATTLCKNRHLEAAGVFDTVGLRIRVEQQRHEPAEPEEFFELLESRNGKKFGYAGKVVCPGCEETEEGETCGWCGGSGLVTVDTWDLWFTENQGCRFFAAGCEKSCKLSSCPQDELRCLLDVPVLLLEARKLGGGWTNRGDSVRGFNLKGLAAHPRALLRYLSLVATSLGFGLLGDD
jgi:hypothetical protein